MLEGTNSREDYSQCVGLSLCSSDKREQINEVHYALSGNQNFTFTYVIYHVIICPFIPQVGASGVNSNIYVSKSILKSELTKIVLKLAWDNEGSRMGVMNTSPGSSQGSQL